MDFKGTKGKWIANYSKGSWLIQDLETYQEGFKSSIAEVYYFEDSKNTAEYNALLISKAPEMLEMLMILVGDIKQGPVDFSKSEKIKMTRRLINEVTGLCENT